MTDVPLPKVTAISGVGGKGPACFLVETGEKRLLLDLGTGPDPCALPNLDGVGPVDALILSHGHRDHAGALDLLPNIGNPPVYATAIVAARLQGRPAVHHLPLHAACEVLGVPIVTGRNGHAPGGIWIRIGIGRGLLYTGDYSTESAVYAFDDPPQAGTIITDASYGADDTPLDRQIAELDAVLARDDVLLPVPADGRGPEIALHVARRGGLDLRLNSAMRASLQRMSASEGAALRPGVARELDEIARSGGPIEGARGAMLATSADGASGEAKRLIAQWEHAEKPAIVFTGYVPPGTPADRLVKSGRAAFMRWNVHPRISDNVKLVRSTGAEIVIPAFCTQSYFDALTAAFAPARVTMDLPLTL